MSIGQVWGTVLGYEELNISDNYYDLGGDSIHAIKVINLLQKSIKQTVTISDLFNHLTISELAEFFESKSEIDKIDYTENNAAGLITPIEKRNYYPVSSAQRRLFILDKLTKDNLSYHIPEVWNIKGKLNVETLINSINKVIIRHEILRTSFELVNDVPVQIINESVEFNIPFFIKTEKFRKRLYPPIY